MGPDALGRGTAGQRPQESIQDRKKRLACGPKGFRMSGNGWEGSRREKDNYYLFSKLFLKKNIQLDE